MRRVARIITLATLAPLLYAGPAVAEEPDQPPLENFDSSVAVLVQGRVPGRPGNWHHLGFGADNDDDGFVGGATDWTCPRGVRPPTVWGESTLCTKEQTSEWSGYPSGRINRREDGYLIAGPYEEEIYTPDGEYVRTDVRTVRLRVRGIGEPDLGYDESGVDRKLWGAVTVCGRIGTVHLGRGRTEVTHAELRIYR